MTRNADQKQGSLTGVRVLELGQLIAGPFCGQLMGDLGADVIKVEDPASGGDPMRQWGQGTRPFWWEVVARNKRSLSINLRHSEGQKLIKKLSKKVDILIENFRPGTLEKWGLDPGVLHHLNPHLIIVRVSGFGQTGPYASRPGYGAIGEAMGGLRYITGSPDRAPSRVGISIGDSLAASFACIGALAALRARDLTGRGQVVDCAIYESVLQVMEGLVPEFEQDGYVRERSGSILPGIAPSNSYDCADGTMLIAANQDTVFVRLCQAMGRPNLAEDERFRSHDARGKNQQELDAIMTDWTSTHSVTDLEELLIAHSVPCGRIFTAADMLENDHFRARRALVQVETDRWGSITMQNCAPQLSETPSSVRRAAPSRVGQHSQEVLAELLGLPGSEFKRLHDSGII